MSGELVPDVPDECRCPGYPCEHSEEQRETLTVLSEPMRGPVTMETVRQLEAAGSYATAEIARRYAVDRPRWWHCFWSVEGK